MKPRVCATVLALLLILSVPAAYADTVLFNDTDANLSVTYTGSTHVLTDFFGNLYGSPGFTPCDQVHELCTVVIFGLSTPPDFGSGVTLYIQEPGTNLVSDIVIGTNPNFAGTYTLTFGSFDDPLFSCPAYGCFLTETGEVQTLYTVAWGDGSLDTIQFQSAPEPVSILLLASGLPAVLVLRRRRRG